MGLNEPKTKTATNLQVNPKNLADKRKFPMPTCKEIWEAFYTASNDHDLKNE